ncbi:MAG: hypothetical protein ACM3WV_11190 [Bacillota bacterium]
MEKTIALEWAKDHGCAGNFEVVNAKTAGLRIVKGEGSCDIGGLAFRFEAGGRIELTLADVNAAPGADPVIVTVNMEVNPFSFFLRDVRADYPVFIPEYRVAVTDGGDPRTYEDIEREIRGKEGLSNLQRIDAEPEESFENAAGHTRNLQCQTWLGIGRDVRIFRFGLRDTGGSSLDWIKPTFHNEELIIPESKGKSVSYNFILGRGMGCTHKVRRRLEDDALPILHGEIEDDDIVYKFTAFASLERSSLSKENIKGTHYLVADGYSCGHMFTEDQEKEFQKQKILAEEKMDEEVVLYFRASAFNTSRAPRYAWFKSVLPHAYHVQSPETDVFLDPATGFSSFSSSGRIYCVSKLNGKPLPGEELPVMVMPGECAVFEFYLPHRPISVERAGMLAKQDFQARHEECRRFWMEKLSCGARIELPEKRIENMLKAGLLHLDLITYGNEPAGATAPAIGIYSPIGSESSPIIQFMDSMGWHDLARRSLAYFLNKQHEDGFMQNFGGYMLETGAVLWNIGEHFRHTRDKSWLGYIKDKLLKSCDFLLRWREENKRDELKGKGYGMMEGKVADPEDPFRAFMLNGYSYLGLSRAAEMLAAIGVRRAAAIKDEAASFKSDIIDSFRNCMARSPVVPLGNGCWCPTVSPWAGYRGPVALHAEGGKWFSHGTHFVRDSLLGALWLVFQEVLEPHETPVDFMLNFLADLMHSRNVAFSQPYYSCHPWVHLRRNEVKRFLKAYYNAFSGLADRETYTFWEHFHLISPHKTHEEGWFLMQTRWMLYMEADGGLELLSGIPRAWLANGSRIKLNKVSSYFGELFLEVESLLESGLIRAEIACNSGRAPSIVKIRLPHPEGKKATNVKGGQYESGNETVVVNGFGGRSQVELMF